MNVMNSFFSSLPLFAIIFLAISCNFFNPSWALVKLPPGVTVTALLAYGDSIMDTGNNNDLKTLVKCDFPPYGQDFIGQKSTGRFGNGKVPSDLLVEELGIKEYLPPYLGPSLSSKELATGVCFASGGSGFDPLTPKIVSVLSMDDQLRLFEEYIGKLKAAFGPEQAQFIIENAIHLVVAGSDDLANTYFTVRVRKLQYDIPAYTNLMVDGALNFVKGIYGLGARRIGVFGAPPIGCVPSQRTLAGGLARECAEEYNAAAKMFNSKLTSALASLNNKLPNAKLVYVDVYSPLLDLIDNHEKYGFMYADKGCCGTGAIEVAVLCNPLSTACEDADSHVFWDSYHPSEAAFKFIVPKLINKYVNKFF